MSLIKFLVDQESRPSAVFGTIALLRAGQGLAVGILFVIVQVTPTLKLIFEWDHHVSIKLRSKLMMAIKSLI